VADGSPETDTAVADNSSRAGWLTGLRTYHRPAAAMAAPSQQELQRQAAELERAGSHLASLTERADALAAASSSGGGAACSVVVLADLRQLARTIAVEEEEVGRAVADTAELAATLAGLLAENEELEAEAQELKGALARRRGWAAVSSRAPAPSSPAVLPAGGSAGTSGGEVGSDGGPAAEGDCHVTLLVCEGVVPTDIERAQEAHVRSPPARCLTTRASRSRHPVCTCAACHRCVACVCVGAGCGAVSRPAHDPVCVRAEQLLRRELGVAACPPGRQQRAAAVQDSRRGEPQVEGGPGPATRPRPGRCSGGERPLQ
jgi:hypothetical protein